MSWHGRSPRAPPHTHHAAWAHPGDAERL